MCRKGLVPTRAVIAAVIFTACVISYMLKVNISISLIAMVEPTKSNGAVHVAECTRKEEHTNSSETQEKQTSSPDYGVRYEWNSNEQGLILGSYFWGYIVTSIPGGLLAERFGAVQVVGVSTALSAILTILTPLAASWHYAAVVASRIMLGLLGGVVYPALHCLVSKWAPPKEKGKFFGAMLGGSIGTVITWPMLGAIIEGWGWTCSFYVPGIMSLVWCGLWYYLVSDTPDIHPNISEEEKFYIVKSFGDSITKTKALPPYKSMFLSIPFWALNVLHFGNLWGLYLLMTAGPKFMSEVLGFNLGHTGIVASLPYLARMVFGFGFGLIGDFIRARGTIPVTVIRKSFVLFSHIIPGVFLIVQTFTGCDTTLAVVFITLALGLNGASTLTNLQNAQDLAPNFAGTIYGIINCIGGTTGFITPLITGALTEKNNGLDEWHIIFWIGAAVYIGCGIIYIIFGTGEQQKWNNANSNPDLKVEGGVENAGFEHIDNKIYNSENTKV